jgi:uncharacterized protein
MGFLSLMTSEERTLITNLFDRLKQVGAQPKDAEADELIRNKVSDQPAAPYLLVQSTLVMQQALTAAQGRIANLEKQLAEATGPAQEPGGSFLSGVANLFGVEQPKPPPRPAQTPPPLPTQPAPQSTYPQSAVSQAFPTRGGGGFLQSALSTAAGVAGGALLFQGIQNLIGHNPGAFAGLAGPSGGLIGGQPAVENTEINVYETNDPASANDEPTAEADTISDPDATAGNDSMSNPVSDETFAPDEGGDFFDSDDSYI